ncbi:MAG: ABC transporter substrate-binding protein [Candidatus Odinarchaeota archaeon]
MLFPILPSVVKAQGTIPVFTVGSCGPTAITDWDTTAYGASTGDYFRWNALEGLFDWPNNAETGSYDNLVPILATSWSVHSRDNEINNEGFMNYDGVDYIDIILRENVTFHDGSDWNATVCKWNIDRHMYILGNINNCLGSSYDATIRNTRPLYWMSISDWDDYATASWDVTNLRGTNIAPGIYLSVYPGFGSSPVADPLGYNRFPRFTNITILNNKQSGGTVRVYFNDWSTGPQYLVNLRFISMLSYKDYFDVPILGYGDHPDFPQDDPATFPGHLIGTGPYIFEGYSYSSDTGTMSRFNDWWNASAQQAIGLHMVPDIAVVSYSHSLAGYTARTTGLLTGDIDFALDRSWEPLGYDDVIIAPNLKYVEMGQENYGEIIVLNSADETYLRYWYDTQYNLTSNGILTVSQFKEANGTIKPVNGVNRAFRKALSYAFDYDSYIALFGGRVVRSGGLVATTHEYYNPSVPLPYTDLNIARQALLDDPYWGPRCTSRHLGLTNTTNDWNSIASSNPIYTFEYHYDTAHEESWSVLTSSLADIGCAIDATLDTPDTYTQIRLYNFPLLSNDGFGIKPFHARINDLGYIQAYYQSTGIIEQDPGAYGRVIADFNSYPYMYPYKGYSNMGFNYNATCDELIAKLWFQNSTGKQQYYSELADWAQNYQYPLLYLANDKIGRAMNKNWETAWYWPFMLHFNSVKYSPTAPAIPGFSVGIVLSVSLLAFIGIAYHSMSKKKKL